MSDLGYQGTERPGDNAGAFNAQAFLIQQFINRMNIGTLVRVQKVTNSGGLSPVGFVDVLPLVNQLAGDDSPVPHAVVHELVYFRLQGGGDAVILDPKVGDIGIAVFADRDISSVKASKGAANPGSGRRNDMADGMYFGGVLNGTPTQYVRFSSTGVEVVSPTKITLKAPVTQIDSALIALNGNIAQTAGTGTGTASFVGPITVVNDVTAGAISLQTHKHTGVQSGGSNTGGPTP